MGSYDKYIEGRRKSIKKSLPKDNLIVLEARKCAQECAMLLVEKFKSKKVYLFGSVVEGSFRKGSDIDLAVEGLKPKHYFRAIVELYKISNGLKIDLIPLESAFYKEEIIKEGELLYG